jgi:hypothetical protein
VQARSGIAAFTLLDAKGECPMKKTSIKPNDAVAEFGCVRWGAQATRSDCAFQEFRSINHMAVRGLAEA